MARRTPEQVVADEIQKMKAMGITVSVIPATSRPILPTDHPFGVIAEAAKAAGIYYEQENK